MADGGLPCPVCKAKGLMFRTYVRRTKVYEDTGTRVRLHLCSNKDCNFRQRTFESLTKKGGSKEST